MTFSRVKRFVRVFRNQVFFLILDVLSNDEVIGCLTFLSSEKSITSPSRSAHINHLTSEFGSSPDALKAQNFIISMCALLIKSSVDTIYLVEISV